MGKYIFLRKSVVDQLNGLDVIGHVDGACEVLCGLGSVAQPACSEVGVFGVVEHQMFHAQLLSQTSRIEGGRVMLLVGIKLLAILVEAECFAQQPVGSACPGLALLTVRLIAQAGQSLSVGQQSTEAELLGLGRPDVKGCDRHVVDLKLLAMLDLAQNDGLVECAVDFARHHQATHGAQGMCHLVVAIDVERAVEFALVHHGRDLAYHPYNSHDVVGVAMCDKEVMHLLDGNASPVKLTKDAVATTGIDHHPAAGCLQPEAGVIASCAHGIARAQHRQSCR